ncbi:UNVERIFIED_CONTAM: hypothetical protein PYX00_010207 [Menopon gallinae]|uniref:Phosphate carrier protein, mitochondrial n=1 Tax=Menopon gallinae TaxID=328185 RepID=A0AAW2HE57_9NEOP
MFSKLLAVSQTNPFWSPFIRVECESKDEIKCKEPAKPPAKGGGKDPCKDAGKGKDDKGKGKDDKGKGKDDKGKGKDDKGKGKDDKGKGKDDKGKGKDDKGKQQDDKSKGGGGGGKGGGGGAGGGQVEFGSPEYFGMCAVGGAICCGLTHLLVTPLDLVKCRIQTDPSKYPGLLKGLGVTYRESGARGLVKGWAPTLIGYSLQGSCKFGLYEFFKVKYAELVGPQMAYDYRTFIYLAASASAEFVADIALSPFEATKVKIQTMECYASTMREAMPKMIEEEGYASFYKSLVPLWLRQIPYTMMKFACFERTIEALYQYVVPKPREQCSYEEQLAVTFTAGYIAGVFCAIVSHPADTVISKMNKDGGSIGENLRNMGFGGLWKGLGARIIMIGTLTGLQWFIYDGVKVYLNIPRPPPPEDPSAKGGGGSKPKPQDSGDKGKKPEKGKNDKGKKDEKGKKDDKAKK